MSKRTYVTNKRVDQLRDSLSDKDMAIIEDVARVNVMSGQQIRRLHFGHSSTDRRMARLHLQQLWDLQILGRLGRRIGGQHSGSDGFVYALDVAGQRLIRPQPRRARPPWTPGPHQLTHALAVSQLYVDLRQLESPTSQLTAFNAEPRCWRRYFGPGGSSQILKPDAYVITSSNGYDDCFMIEIDRSTESTTRIAEKLKSYVSYYQSGREQSESGVFPRIVWSVLTEARRTQLIEVIGDLPADLWPLFVVIINHEVAGHLTGTTNERR
jgi:hypothetical protein